MSVPGSRARAWRRLTRCLLGLALGAAACSSVTPAPPLARVRLGPAAARPLRRVVALPSTCGGVDGDCKEGYTAAVDGAIRQELEFAGYSVVDSETVASRAKERRQRLQTKELVASDRSGLRRREQSASSETTVTGASYVDLSPGEQAALLTELGAQGVVMVRTAIGGWESLSGRKQVEVQVTLYAGAMGDLVWASRCTTEAGTPITAEQAVERGARCAVKGATAR